MGAIALSKGRGKLTLRAVEIAGKQVADVTPSADGNQELRVLSLVSGKLNKNQPVTSVRAPAAAGSL